MQGRLARLVRRFVAEQPPVPWPSLAEELAPYRAYLRGEVLNAGAGSRSIAALVEGKLTNQDITPDPDDPGRIVGPLSRIPRTDDSFDVVVCNAVLEHVDDPDAAMREMHRVLRPGGHLLLCVPFMQPEHLVPADYQRYTQGGLRRLAERHGFTVLAAEPVHSVYHTLGWIVHEWLTSRRSLSYWLLRRATYPILRYKARRSAVQVATIASAYRVLAVKR